MDKSTVLESPLKGISTVVGFFNNQEPIPVKNVILSTSLFDNNNTDNVYEKKQDC